MRENEHNRESEATAEATTMAMVDNNIVKLMACKDSSKNSWHYCSSSS